MTDDATTELRMLASETGCESFTTSTTNEFKCLSEGRRVDSTYGAYRACWPCRIDAILSGKYPSEEDLEDRKLKTLLKEALTETPVPYHTRPRAVSTVVEALRQHYTLVPRQGVDTTKVDTNVRATPWGAAT